MKIRSFILADGSVRSADHLNLDTGTIDAVLRAGSAAQSKTFGFNLYNASDAPFCLGSKAYRSADEAEDNASTRKGNYFSSFEVKYNPTTGAMTLVDGDDGTPTYKRYALFDGSKFSKPSYADLHAAHRARISSNQKVIEIGVRGTEVVSVRTV